MGLLLGTISQCYLVIVERASHCLQLGPQCWALRLQWIAPNDSHFKGHLLIKETRRYEQEKMIGRKVLELIGGRVLKTVEVTVIRIHVYYFQRTYLTVTNQNVSITGL